MALDPGLLEILACPDDKGPLRYFRDEDLLYNPRLGRTYPIQDGIPVLLISEAQALDDDERQRRYFDSQVLDIVIDIHKADASG